MLVASTISTAHARVARAAITMIDTPGDSRSAFFSRAANLALLFRTARIPRARYASKNQNCPRERRNGCDYNNRSGYPDLIRASVLTRRRLRPMEATANAHSHLKRAKALPSLPITLSGAPGFSRTIACRVHRCALGLRHDNRGMRIPSEGSANWDVVVNDQAALCNAGGSVPGRYTEHSASGSIIM
jgi:hypothetical protein